MFLHGFRLLTTGRKNHNDLLRGVTPLWRPRDQPSFTFGGRYRSLINHPVTYWTMTDPRDDKRSAAVVLEQIMPFVREFEGIQTVADFLIYFDFMRENRTPPVRLDFAIADYLAGDLDRCLRGLSYVESVLGDYYESTIKAVEPVLNQVRSQLHSDPAGLRDLLDSWRLENIKRMGLAVNQ